ncbi:MAG: 30S ribosomal protein S20 [Deltaproteobacteria bacterium]
MANIPSVIKRNRQAQKQRARNVGVRTAVKHAVKQVRVSLEGKDGPASKEAIRAAMRTLNKASSKGVLHARTAARRISRLAKAVDGLTKKA